MTFSVSLREDNKNVDVQITQGSVTVKAAEHYAHLRGFWHELGKVLDEAEKRNAPHPVAVEHVHVEDGDPGPGHASLGT